MLLNQLSTLLPNATYQSNGTYVADGLVKSSLSIKTNWPAQFLKAAYNFQFVANDGSLGVHNAPYAVGLLKASIANLSGRASNRAFRTRGKFSASADHNPLAAQDATPTGGGFPNWLKYALGINPSVHQHRSAHGCRLGQRLLEHHPGKHQQSHLYIHRRRGGFRHPAGTTYQIQAISSLGGGWSNVGGAIVGDGNTMSYLTPTRNDSMQFYRVVNTP